MRLMRANGQYTLNHIPADARLTLGGCSSACCFGLVPALAHLHILVRAIPLPVALPPVAQHAQPAQLPAPAPLLPHAVSLLPDRLIEPLKKRQNDPEERDRRRRHQDEQEAGAARERGKRRLDAKRKQKQAALVQLKERAAKVRWGGVGVGSRVLVVGGGVSALLLVYGLLQWRWRQDARQDVLPTAGCPNPTLRAQVQEHLLARVVAAAGSGASGGSEGSGDAVNLAPLLQQTELGEEQLQDLLGWVGRAELAVDELRAVHRGLERARCGQQLCYELPPGAADALCRTPEEREQLAEVATDATRFQQRLRSLVWDATPSEADAQVRLATLPALLCRWRRLWPTAACAWACGASCLRALPCPCVSLPPHLNPGVCMLQAAAVLKAAPDLKPVTHKALAALDQQVRCRPAAAAAFRAAPAAICRAWPASGAAGLKHPSTYLWARPPCRRRLGDTRQ